MDLGKRFKSFRLKKGLTQSQAAELIGIKYYQLGNYETNRSEPSIEILKKMSQVYDVSIDHMVYNYRFKEENGNTVQPPETDYDDLVSKIKEFIEDFEKNKK